MIMVMSTGMTTSMTSRMSTVMTTSTGMATVILMA